MPAAPSRSPGVEGIFGDDRAEGYGFMDRYDLDAVLEGALVDREGDFGVVHFPLRDRGAVPAGSGRTFRPMGLKSSTWRSIWSRASLRSGSTAA